MNSAADHSPDQPLLNAFLTTDYLVRLGEQCLKVRIGHRHPVLDQLLENRQWAILTAANPGATGLSARVNEERHRILADQARLADVATLPTINRDPTGRWPDEHGLLLIAPARPWLLEQARRFEQIGLVHGQAGLAAELWLLGTRLDAGDHEHIRVVTP